MKMKIAVLSKRPPYENEDGVLVSDITVAYLGAENAAKPKKVFIPDNVYPSHKILVGEHYEMYCNDEGVVESFLDEATDLLFQDINNGCIPRIQRTIEALLVTRSHCDPDSDAWYLLEELVDHLYNALAVLPAVVLSACNT